MKVLAGSIAAYLKAHFSAFPAASFGYVIKFQPVKR